MSQAIDARTVVGNVQLRVSDLERSIGFYRTVVGLRLLSRNEQTAQLGVPGSDRPLLKLTEIPGAKPRPRRSGAGLYHFALLVPDRRSLGLALRNLIAAGIHIGQSDHLVSEALYLSDPDNNGIEIYRDRPRSEWQWDANGHVRMAVDPLDWDGLLAEAGDAPWNGLPAGTTMGHIHLHVTELPTTEHFYVDVLGFDAVASMADSALFISAGGYHHHIGLNVWAGVGAPLTPQDAPGLDCFDIVVPTEEAQMSIFAKLQAASVPLRTDRGTIIVHDPSGIQLHIVVRSPA
ncbi:VOC family protein [Paenibacillus sacheonensis]|uniref:Glyoxalase n=1 Tax=Paenibacillus sacheonensis TaxID=742054 RepID=A0A7X4YPQ8_9BACL|nr:VOC family protein [Paenibacillus sacheonensis]MBM7564985.1 catechol 2,3-dioxygenase [Paenibacillus sacheonensis]NBC70227.1 glyoxalase [Paenibacillus sacheonensis]